MILEWWQWIVFGIALIVAELAIPAMVLIWFGLGALLVGALAGVMPVMSLTFQLAVWTFASVSLTVLWFKLFKRGIHKTRIGMSHASIVGEIGMLVHDVAPFKKGRVRFQKPLVGSEIWDCIADESIKSGERVQVLSVEGSFLKVGKQ